MSQIPTVPDVPRDARDPDPNTTPTPPSTRYPPPPAAATSRPPPLTTNPTATNLAGNQVSLQAALTSVQGDPLVALETILGERNTLSSQNSQLWKIIEKQRGMYNSLHKELDRVKADRDRLQSKSSTDLSTKRAAAGDSTSRKQITRSQSEDRPLRAVAPSTRSQEPANAIDHPASMSPQTLSRTDAQTSNPTRQGSLPTASPPTPRQSSVPVPSVTATTGDSEAKFKAPNSPPTQSHFSVQPQPPPQLNYAPLPPVSVPSIQSLLSVGDHEKSRRSARESRIMVPDEVARYIQAQQDSPMPSPRPRAAELPPSQESPDPIGGSPNPAPAVQQESTRSTPSHTPTDEDVPPEDRSSYYNPPFQALSPPPSHRKPPPSRDPGDYPTVTAAGAADGPNTDSQRNTRSTTSLEEMESDSVATGRIPSRLSPVTSSSGSTTDGGSTAPRSTFQSYNDEPTQSSFSPYQSTNAYGNYQQQQQYSQTPTMNQAHQVSQTNGYPSAEFLTTTATANGNMFQASSYPSQGNISRSNPPLLVPMELPITRIRVVSSHIRSNERGKDVLAFCIQVQPSQRESWVIEKMYSDVLSLDSRVRALLSKNTLKKLAPLPDPKLFKDNAPAKVDQRKMLLEQYLQSVVTAPLKDVGDLCAFLVTDLSKGDRAPVSNQGYKEGYLTKRGKNFGGWKTRYFILQNGVLEYYENRGGTHLGSIHIGGAQIGRQQKQASVDDENAYRHAFLIIEAKRGPSGANIRHVLCASSDTDRDSWVDVLVRYVAGSFDDSYASGSSTGPSIEGHSRQSVGSMESQRPTARPRTMSNNDMVRGGGAVLGSPLQQHDPNSAKLFHSSASQPEGISPTERPIGLSDAQLALRMIERGNSGGSISGFAMSTSLPSSLEPSIAQGPSAPASYQSLSQPSSQTSLTRRASSEQGFYPESRGAITDQRIAAPKSRLEKPSHRASTHPSLPTVDSSTSRQQLIDAGQGSDIDAGPGGKKISGPSNATPIPPGQGWGNKQPLLTTGDTPPSDRERKVKSKFWSSFNRVPGVGGMVSSGSGSGSDRERSNAGVLPPILNPARFGDPARAVFAVPLEQALTVAQIANLPAIVFRCIEYLEAKKSDQEEGIYRLSGSTAVIKGLKDRFNAEGDINLLKNDEYWDPHAIAGLLKLYLRELPNSLLTRELQQRFLGVVDLLDPKDRVTELSQLVASLPISNYSLLRALNAHLINIVQNNAVNKMNIRNMGIVFSPTLQIPAGIFSLMLSDFKQVFNVDAAESESDTTSTTDAESTVAEMSPSEGKSGNRQQQQDRVNKRNSMLYAHASADQMLGLGGRQLEAPEESDEEDIIKAPDDDSDSDISYEDIRALPSASDRPPRQSNGKQYQGQPTTPPVRIDAPEEDQQLLRGDSAKAVASNKGLQINVTVTPGLRSKRISGLPHSPRPVGKAYQPPASPAMSNDSGSR